MESVQDLLASRSRELAISYRNLVLCFGSQLVLGLVNITGNLTLSHVAAGVFGTVVAALGAGSLLALVYFGYRTASALGSGVAWAWAVGMALPCLNIIALLVLSSRATQMCRAAGIPVGLLGPKLAAAGTESRNGGAA